MEFKLDGKFKKELKGKVNAYAFEVGILKDKAHKWPLSYKLHGLKTFLNGVARKSSRVNSYSMNSDISQRFRKKHNYLKAPFKNRKNADIVNFLKVFFDTIKGRSQGKRLRNLLQAIVRNPILRGDYGRNKAKTIKRKGFDRYMIDTGQFFNSIIARVSKAGLDV